jgi:anti-sigma B factor antagonist
MGGSCSGCWSPLRTPDPRCSTHFCRCFAERLPNDRGCTTTSAVACGDDVEPEVSTEEPLRWSVRCGAEGIDVALAGEMDLATSGPLAQALTEVLDTKPVTVRLDLAEVSFLDSSGIRCLVGAAERAAAVGGHLVVRNPTPMVLRVLELCGVDQLLLADGTDGNASPWESSDA